MPDDKHLYSRAIQTTNRLTKGHTPIYFSDGTIPKEHRSKTISFEDNGLLIRFVRSDDQLISFPYAPWGSFLITEAVTVQGFKVTLEKIKKYAESNAIKKLEIRHPPRFYDHSVPESWFVEEGFSMRKEINQHLELSRPVEIHPMEKRKLKKTSGRWEIIQINDFTRIYDALDTWRSASGIPLNIERSHLIDMATSFPDVYQGWGVSDSNQLIAVCVSILVTDSIAYYFLPATHPAYRKQSPMVSLLHQMSNHYKKEGFSVFDLGQTSVMGQKQDSLFLFKERMGARSTHKPVFELAI